MNLKKLVYSIDGPQELLSLYLRGEGFRVQNFSAGGRFGSIHLLIYDGPDSKVICGEYFAGKYEPRLEVFVGNRLEKVVSDYLTKSDNEEKE